MLVDAVSVSQRQIKQCEPVHIIHRVEKCVITSIGIMVTSYASLFVKMPEDA